MNELLVNERRAAKLLNVSPRTLWAWRRAGIIPCVRIGRSVRYSIRSLEAWIQEREAAAGQATRAANPP